MTRLATWTAAAALFFALFLGSACQVPKGLQPRGPVQALWVTRFDYQTRDDIDRIVAACKDASVDRVMFQVRGNATAFYPSSLEPWAEQFQYASPGFDPLAYVIEAGRAANLEVHAWINVMPAWWGTVPPSNPNQVWNKHPEWLWYDAEGNKQPFSERFYVSLNPCLPEVRDYLVAVLRDLVARYAVDGLHLDYIRFPNEFPATPKGRDYPRDPKTLALFKADTNATPESDPEAWRSWRAEQVNLLMREIRYMLKRTKPAAELSAAVGPDPDKALREHFQDARTWMREQLVDALYPMNYATDLAVFEKRSAVWRELAGNTRVVMGVRIGSKDVDTQVEQLAQSIRNFNGYCMFAFASLYDSPGDALEKQDEDARFERAQIRKALVPKLRTLLRGG